MKNPNALDSFNTTIVSVEFDGGLTQEELDSLFQYNHCFGGINKGLL